MNLSKPKKRKRRDECALKQLYPQPAERCLSHKELESTKRPTAFHKRVRPSGGKKIVARKKAPRQEREMLRKARNDVVELEKRDDGNESTSKKKKEGSIAKDQKLGGLESIFSERKRAT